MSIISEAKFCARADYSKVDKSKFKEEGRKQLYLLADYYFFFLLFFFSIDDRQSFT